MQRSRVFESLLVLAVVSYLSVCLRAEAVPIPRESSAPVHAGASPRTALSTERSFPPNTMDETTLAEIGTVFGSEVVNQVRRWMRIDG